MPDNDHLRGGRTMVLARVIYELFETDADTADAADRGEAVFLGRQLRLEFVDGRRVFVAWTWGALPDSEYHVGWSHESFCKEPAEVEHDATKIPVWARLVGHEISLHFRDPQQQVLEVRTEDAAVFCCSFEQWWYADTLYVGKRPPEDVDHPGAA